MVLPPFLSFHCPLAGGGDDVAWQKGLPPSVYRSLNFPTQEFVLRGQDDHSLSVSAVYPKADGKTSDCGQNMTFPEIVEKRAGIGRKNLHSPRAKVIEGPFQANSFLRKNRGAGLVCEFLQAALFFGEGLLLELLHFLFGTQLAHLALLCFGNTGNWPNSIATGPVKQPYAIFSQCT